MENSFLKNQIQKTKKKQKIKVKVPRVNKKSLTRVWFKQKPVLEKTMNGLGKPFRKKVNPKN